MDSIEGVWYNETYVPFKTVVVATGGEHKPDPITTTFGIDWDHRTEYYLIGEVSGDCPEDYYGNAHPACLVILTLRCKAFPGQ